MQPCISPLYLSSQARSQAQLDASKLWRRKGCSLSIGVCRKELVELRKPFLPQRNLILPPLLRAPVWFLTQDLTLVLKSPSEHPKSLGHHCFRASPAPRSAREVTAKAGDLADNPQSSVHLSTLCWGYKPGSEQPGQPTDLLQRSQSAKSPCTQEPRSALIS